MSEDQLEIQTLTPPANQRVVFESHPSRSLASASVSVPGPDSGQTIGLLGRRAYAWGWTDDENDCVVKMAEEKDLRTNMIQYPFDPAARRWRMRWRRKWIECHPAIPLPRPLWERGRIQTAETAEERSRAKDNADRCFLNATILMNYTLNDSRWGKLQESIYAQFGLTDVGGEVATGVVLAGSSVRGAEGNSGTQSLHRGHPSLNSEVDPTMLLKNTAWEEKDSLNQQPLPSALEHPHVSPTFPISATLPTDMFVSHRTDLLWPGSDKNAEWVGWDPFLLTDPPSQMSLASGGSPRINQMAFEGTHMQLSPHIIANTSSERASNQSLFYPSQPDQAVNSQLMPGTLSILDSHQLSSQSPYTGLSSMAIGSLRSQHTTPPISYDSNPDIAYRLPENSRHPGSLDGGSGAFYGDWQVLGRGNPHNPSCRRIPTLKNVSISRMHSKPDKTRKTWGL